MSRLEKAAEFGSRMGKLAAEILPSSDLGKGLAGSFGRFYGAPAAVLVGQEKAKDFLADSDENKHRKFIDLMNKAHPKELSDVGIRMGGTSTMADIKRIWQSDRTTALNKVLGTAVTPIINLRADFNRSSHYNPLSNMANVYGNVGEITAHELGHAVDFNTVRSGKPSDAFNRIKRDAYIHARMPEDLLGLSAGPVTHLTEIRANRNVNSALNLMKDPEEAEEIKANTWRRLAPAYGTYVGATALGGAVLHHNLSGGGPDTPLAHLVRGTDRVLGNPDNKWALPMAISMGALGAGAIGGRLFAEGRNLLYGPSKKVNKGKGLKGGSGYTSNVTPPSSGIGK